MKVQPTRCPSTKQTVHQLANEAVVIAIHLPPLGTLWGLDSVKYLKVSHIYTYVEIMMIGDGIWYSEPDNNRTPWMFLLIETQGGEIVEWQVCYGSRTQIVKIVHVEGSQEREALEKLIDEIKGCRRGTLLITCDRETLPTLRRKLLKHNAKGVSLRGFKHVCVQDLFIQYFGSKGEADDIDRNPSALWKIFKEIGPLVPERALEGEPL